VCRSETFTDARDREDVSATELAECINRLGPPLRQHYETLKENEEMALSLEIQFKKFFDEGKQYSSSVELRKLFEESKDALRSENNDLKLKIKFQSDTQARKQTRVIPHLYLVQ
jgi:hypothetical protein